MKSTTCYTHVSIPGHFRILSECDGRCSIVNSHDESEPGRRFSGIKRADLRTCNCGRWQWPKSSVVKVEGGKHRFSIRGRDA